MANLWDNAACMELDRFLDARGIRHAPPTLGSTLGSPPGGHGHTAGSNHYPEWWGGPRGSTGQARDYGDKASDCEAIARAFEPYARGPNYVISELIWTRSKWPLSRNGIYYKRGVAYVPSFSLARQHNDHDHVAIAVGRHLPGIILPTPQPAPPPPPQEDNDMKGRIIQCKPDGPFGDAAKSNLGWFFACADRGGTYKWEVSSGRLADELALYGQISNVERDAQGHIRPYLVDESIFDAYTTV